jgi:hypothetical protein
MVTNNNLIILNNNYSFKKILIFFVTMKYCVYNSFHYNNRDKWKLFFPENEY